MMVAVVMAAVEMVAVMLAAVVMVAVGTLVNRPVAIGDGRLVSPETASHCFQVVGGAAAGNRHLYMDIAGIHLPGHHPLPCLY